MDFPLPVDENVPLAPLTTLEVGGPARYLASCATVGELRRWLGWARSLSLPACVLGGGSNLLVADRGFDGLCLRLRDATVELEPRRGGVLVRAAAGAGWDALVACTVAEGLGGLECLSGIPGRVGAAPIQNIGAYGQEAAETLAAVQVIERRGGAVRELAAAECGFGYRQSRFKSEWRDRFVVTRVDFLLPRRAAGTVRYAELRRAFGMPEGAGSPAPSLEEVRRTVLEIRRGKSMVIEPGDPNRRSAGSFFVNPVAPPERAEAVRRRWRERAGGQAEMPAYPAAGGRVKLSAAWLIEQAGYERGYRLGRAALSSRHTLALINRGGATAAEIVALAAQLRRGVHRAFGVTLDPEPVFLGFSESVEELLG